MGSSLDLLLLVSASESSFFFSPGVCFVFLTCNRETATKIPTSQDCCGGGLR